MPSSIIDRSKQATHWLFILVEIRERGGIAHPALRAARIKVLRKVSRRQSDMNIDAKEPIGPTHDRGSTKPIWRNVDFHLINSHINKTVHY